jgi:hypothetical protein
MRLIEFTGLPGAGKSTVFPLVKKACAGKCSDICDANDVYVKLINELPCGVLVDAIVPSRQLKKKISSRWFRRAAVKQKYQAAAIQQQQLLNSEFHKINNSRGISADESSRIVSWFLSTLSIYTAATKALGKDDCLILDEGFFHKILSLFAAAGELSKDETAIKHYLDLIPSVDTLVYVETGVHECIDRIASSKAKRRYGWLDDEKFEAVLNHMKWLIDFGVSYVEGKGTQIVRINNEDEFTSSDDVEKRIPGAF